MPQTRSARIPLTVHPLTPDRWDDFAALFGPNGACGGCWCMTWRLSRAEFVKGKGNGNKNAIRRLVRRGDVPGLLAYCKDEPVGWCSVAPREEFPVLSRSRVLKPIDDRPVWSVTCLFVAKTFRNRGVSVEMLKAAADHAKRCGAKIIEGYPVEPTMKPMPAVFAWTGLPAAFLKAGFTERARRSKSRPIMRIDLVNDAAKKRR